jgi:hypothetical protein
MSINYVSWTEKNSNFRTAFQDFLRGISFDVLLLKKGGFYEHANEKKQW